MAFKRMKEKNQINKNPNCHCEAWQKNYSKLTSMNFIAAIHNCGSECEQFKFCPWCGKKVEEIEIKQPERYYTLEEAMEVMLAKETNKNKTRENKI